MLLEQVVLGFKRLSNNIILCLDGDGPGHHATLSIGNTLLEQGIETKVISLPDPDDPDTYILKNGKERFLGLIDSALNFSDYKLQKMRDNVDFRSDEEKAKYINQVIMETAKLDDPIRIEVVLKRLAKEFDISYNTLELRMNSLKKVQDKPKEVIIPKKQVVRKNKYIKAFEQILYFMLNNDWVITQVEKEHLIFSDETMRHLYDEIVYYYKMNGEINVADFYTYVQDKENILLLLNNILAGDYSETTDKEELDLYFDVVRDYSKKQEIKRLTNLMKKEVDPLEQAKIVERIRKLRLGDS